MHVLEILKSATRYLDEAGVGDAGADAELLLLHSTGIDRITAYRDNPEVDSASHTLFQGLLERRASGEPVQYITGSVDFLGLKMEVGRGVLIPRPETELVALEGRDFMRALTQAPENLRPSEIRVLDLCSGSGCISLVLASEFPDAAVFGTDIAETAIRYSLRNAQLNGVSNVKFLEGSLYGPAEDMSPFNLIISNPPYVLRADIEGLQREIREWEPVDALDGGPDGLDFYRKIFAGALKHLRKRGAVVLETGFGQAGEVSDIAAKAGFGNIVIKKDLAGIERILIAKIGSEA